MAADSFTKTLTTVKFEEFQDLIGLMKENDDLDFNNSQISNFDDKSNFYNKINQYTNHSNEDNE